MTLFNGGRLRIARQRQAITRKALSEQIGVSPRAVTGWESGDYPPEESHVRLLSSMLNFPTSFFYLDDPAGTDKTAVSFRSLSKKSAGQRDAVIAMCDLAVDLVRWIEKGFGLPRWGNERLHGERPDIAASLIRQEWGLGQKPIKSMLHLLEAKGVRVLALSQNCREIDACSFWSDGTPFVLLNTTVSNERMRFDMAHELGHLLMHEASENVGREAEKEANEFASELLMPQASIVAHRPRIPTLDALIQHKRHWNVSVAALAYRLHKERYISDWNFKSLNIEMGRRGYRTKEPNSSQHEVSHVFEVVLKRLREKGMPLSFVANQLSLPVDEVSQMIAGIAKVSIEGDRDAVDSKSEGSHLRLVR